MNKARIAIMLFLGIMLVSALACGTTEWQLTTTIEGQGAISPSSSTYPDGEVVTLTALPESGWDFDHWGVQASGSANPITVTMDADKTVSAYFTLAPSPTPTPTPTVLFSDDFNDPSSGWDTYSDSDGSVSYKDGWLQLTNYRNAIRATTSYSHQHFTDYILEVETKLVAGEEANWHSIGCRMDELAQGYMFAIGADGTYYISKVVDMDHQIALKEPTRSIHINTGKGTTNLIHIECIGNSLSLSVNGHLLWQSTDYTYTSGQISLMTSCLSGSAASYTTVAFDNIVVTAP